jgi:hypothetical protein
MTDTPENTGRDQAGRFGKGRSGNPAGKPRGTRHRITALAEKLIGEDAEAVLQKVIAAAKLGDMQAARMIIERILPPRKDRPISFKMPPISSANDAPKAMAAITAAVATGELTPAEGREIAAIVEIYVRAVETAEVVALAARLDELEKEARR